MNVCVAGASPLRLARRGDTPIKNTKNMENDHKRRNLTVPGGRITQKTADVPGVVPARPLCIGLAEVLSAGNSDQLCTAENDNNDYGKGHDYDNGKDEGLDREGVMKEEREMDEAATDTGSQDTVLLDINDQVILPPWSHLPDNCMDMAECRKRVREKSLEEEEDEIRPSQKLRKDKIRTLRDSLGEAEKEQEKPVRQIKISDDDEDVEFVMNSQSGIDEDEGQVKEVRRGPGRPRKIRRKVMGVKEIEPREYSDSEGNEGLSLLSTSEMGATGIAYVERVDAIRKTCGNIKGSLSGEMKKKLQDTREIIKGLVRRSNKGKDGGGDEEVKELRKRNKELLLELKKIEMKENGRN